MSPDAEVTLTLSALAYGGDALGRLEDGRALFVPFALPGEMVRVRLMEEKRGFARGELLEVLQPSPERIAPRCAHFGACGGCHYQHMPYEPQLNAKRLILAEQLERIGGLRQPPVRETVPSPEPFNYRNHVQFHLTPQGKLGYYTAAPSALRSDDVSRPAHLKVLPIQECHLPEHLLNLVWPQLDFEAMDEIERVGLRLGAGDDVQLILESRDLQPPELSVEDLPISVIHLSQAGTLVLAGSPALVMEVLDRPFRVSAGSFFQVNTRMAGAMVQHVLGSLDERQALTPGSLVVDVYCGVGLFSAFLAPRVGWLIGIEASPFAADDFVLNLDEFDNVALYEAEAEAVLPQIDQRPDAVILDPPRQGIARPALDGLLRLSAPLLVYVSCDPATLARDAKRLQGGGYRLEEVTPFDLFPQTYHIESISLWSKR